MFQKIEKVINWLEEQICVVVLVVMLIDAHASGLAPPARVTAVILGFLECAVGSSTACSC